MFSEIQQLYKEKGEKIIREPNFDEMLATLLENLGSIDSDTREGSLDMLWEMLECGEMPDDLMLSTGTQLTGNLSQGVGEKCSDHVFLRTFSALLVGVIAAQDEIRHEHGKSFIPEKTFVDWFEKCKTYVRSEKDFRSFVPGKGWAHAISHGADLLRDFAFHRCTSADDHAEILEILADKMIENHEEVYINNDDNRIARVVVTIMLRNRLALADYEKWLDGLINRFAGKTLLDFHGEREKVIPWFNTISFLRALYFVLLNGMKVLQDGEFYQRTPELREEMISLVLNSLNTMDHGLNYQQQKVND